MSVLALIDLSALMSVNVPLQIEGYHYSQRPIIEPDIGRVGTQMSVEGYGFIEATNAADFLAAVNALAGFGDGSDLIIKGCNGVILQQVLAATCVDGGPHIGFEILDEQAAGFYRRVKFTAEAKTIGNITLNSYTIKTATGADGLKKITQSGVIVGTSAPSVFETVVLANFKASYNFPRYIVIYDVTYPYQTEIGNQFDIVTRYSLSAVQLAGDLPAVSGVADGEVTIRSETDEQQRVTDTWEYELNLDPSSDYNSAIDSLRTITTSNESDSAKLIRETTTVTTIKQLRVHATFVFLDTAANNALLDYSRTIRVTGSDDTYEEFTYPGADPIAVKRPGVFARISDSGRATGLGSFFQVPDPLTDYYERSPVTTLTDVSDVEKRTEWDLEMIDVDGTLSGDISTLAADIMRPTDPDFY